MKDGISRVIKIWSETKISNSYLQSELAEYSSWCLLGYGTAPRTSIAGNLNLSDSYQIVTVITQGRRYKIVRFKTQETKYKI